MSTSAPQHLETQAGVSVRTVRTSAGLIGAYLPERGVVLLAADASSDQVVAIAHRVKPSDLGGSPGA